MLNGLQCFCAGVLVPYGDSSTKNMPVLVEFHKKHVAREIITRVIENTQDKDQGEENVELFCYRETLYDELNHILVVMM